MSGGGARQGLLAFEYEMKGTPRELTARAGLPLVAETMLALGLPEVTTALLRVEKRRRGYTDYEKLQALVLVLAAGGECVEDVRVLGRDEGLSRLLSGRLPSPDALHGFLRSFHEERVAETRPEGAWIPEECEVLLGLGAVSREVVRRAVLGRRPKRATLDLDATIIESHKRDALPHYKGGRGYQPTAVVWAEEDLVVADQYRDGNVPAGMATQEVARRALESLPGHVTERFFRGDSACYDQALLRYLWKQGVAFTISADMTREMRTACTAPEVNWSRLEDRLDETVDVAEVEYTPGEWPRSAPAMRYVGLRFLGRQGRLFADGNDTKYLAVVSNRWEPTTADLVRWHWKKAGTIEYVHDVMKNELGARIPPSGRFGANAAWYRLSLMTYNLLTVLRRTALPARFAHCRPDRLRYELFTVPAEIHSHARRTTARLGLPALAVEELVETRRKLLRLAETIRSGVALSG